MYRFSTLLHNSCYDLSYVVLEVPIRPTVRRRAERRGDRLLRRLRPTAASARPQLLLRSVVYLLCCLSMYSLTSVVLDIHGQFTLSDPNHALIAHHQRFPGISVQVWRQYAVAVPLVTAFCGDNGAVFRLCWF